MYKIFVNYRQTESSWTAGYIAEKIRSALGNDLVFIDERAIDAGDDISTEIDDALDSVSVLLVVIEKNWLGVQDKNYRRRIDHADDWVRYEIRSCLQRDDCKVIPVIFDDSELPNDHQLPTDLAKLSRCKSFCIHSKNKDLYIANLIDSISETIGLPKAQNRTNIIRMPIEQERHRVICESLSLNGRLDLSRINSPYDDDYDPERWGEDKANILVRFPEISEVLRAKNKIQIPAVALCIDSKYSFKLEDLLGDELFSKFMKFRPASLFDRDKEIILKQLSPLFENGLVAGVTLPVSLFASKNNNRKRRNTHSALVNSLMLPLLEYHKKLDFTVNRIKVSPVGDLKKSSKFLELISSETSAEVKTLNNEELRRLIGLLSWCLGAAINNGKGKWFDIIKNG